jgi:hypothetical protein
VLAGVKTLSVATDRKLDQSSEVEATGSGADGVTRPQENVANNKRARSGDEPDQLTSGESP